MELVWNCFYFLKFDKCHWIVLVKNQCINYGTPRIVKAYSCRYWERVLLINKKNEKTSLRASSEINNMWKSRIYYLILIYRIMAFFWSLIPTICCWNELIKYLRLFLALALQEHICPMNALSWYPHSLDGILNWIFPKITALILLFVLNTSELDKTYWKLWEWNKFCHRGRGHQSIMLVL